MMYFSKRAASDSRSTDSASRKWLSFAGTTKRSAHNFPLALNAQAQIAEPGQSIAEQDHHHGILRDDGVAHLRANMQTRIVVAALGPKMCQLAGEVADGVLFNWLTPEHARLSAGWVREGAKVAGRTPPTPTSRTCASRRSSWPRS